MVEGIAYLAGIIANHGWGLKRENRDRERESE